MDDTGIWRFEETLWTCDAEHYRRSIAKECLMVLPAQPFIQSGEEAIAAVSSTPRWAKATLSERHISHPQEGIIVIAYKASAERDGIAPYEAHCTTTYKQFGVDTWQVIQHQQTPPLAAPAKPDVA